MKSWPRTAVASKLTQSRAGNPTINKDVKNADRSEEVYENKGKHDIMSNNKSDFVSGITGISRFSPVFERHLVHPKHRLAGFPRQLSACRR
jgi:hypothetical protein